MTKDTFRIAVTGFVGVGKTSLCEVLRRELGLDLIGEDMGSITDAGMNYMKLLGGADRRAMLSAKGELVEAFIAWARDREDAYLRHPRAIADRWEADLLGWWLMSFAGRFSSVDSTTAKLIEDMQRKARLFDYVVLMPVRTPFGARGSRNDDGLHRNSDLTTHIFDHSITYGLIHSFTKSRVINIPVHLESTAERAEVVMRVIADARSLV